jgi:hypothetical protein
MSLVGNVQHCISLHETLKGHSSSLLFLPMQCRLGEYLHGYSTDRSRERRTERMKLVLRVLCPHNSFLT